MSRSQYVRCIQGQTGYGSRLQTAKLQTCIQTYGITKMCLLDWTWLNHLHNVWYIFRATQHCWPVTSGAKVCYHQPWPCTSVSVLTRHESDAGHRPCDCKGIAALFVGSCEGIAYQLGDRGCGSLFWNPMNQLGISNSVEPPITINHGISGYPVSYVLANPVLFLYSRRFTNIVRLSGWRWSTAKSPCMIQSQTPPRTCWALEIMSPNQIERSIENASKYAD